MISKNLLEPTNINHSILGMGSLNPSGKYIQFLWNIEACLQVDNWPPKSPAFPAFCCNDRGRCPFCQRFQFSKRKLPGSVCAGRRFCISWLF